ncbi:Serine/threonine protein kinase [hydrothermal vent metagenome]|uniref:Serine/threonine protein kinase n=1 Tax=hydrothermal vent metagenome TaxID=652676 RepID=A0A3B0YCH7_9ZZZZ
MSHTLQINFAQSSDAGVKDNNEDSYGVISPEDQMLENKGITAIIADGMGSCAHPKEASEYVVKGFFSDYYSTPDSWTVKTSAAKVLTALNSWLYGKSTAEQVKAYVSTFSALILKSTTAHIIHIGDSRIYRLRDGTIEQLTTDHRIWISPKKNYLSRAMGVDLHLDIDYKTVSLEMDDVFIMTTDGIHDYLNDQAILEIVSQSSNMNVLADQLVSAALANDSHDNVTCQIIHIENLPAQQANEVINELTRLPFPPDLSPGMILDGYRVLSELHASTSSQLYLVEDSETGKTMLMKTPSVNYDDDPSYIERFHMEEWAGKRVYHPNVMITYEQKRKRSCQYFLIEYIEGITLAEWIKQHPTPDIKKVTHIIDQIIQGLRGLHRLEMLHRDLKPDNIMIQSDGTVKLIDLGAVKVAGIQEISSPVEHLELPGTKNYIAPEYLIGMAGSNKSDLFSLGVISYEMLTGHVPYGDQSEKNVDWRSISKIRYISSLKHNPMIPLWLDGALEKAVKIDHRVRYDSLSEYFHDLTHPNESFMKNNLPLAEKDPLIFWQSISAALVVINLILVYFIIKS